MRISSNYVNRSVECIYRPDLLPFFVFNRWLWNFSIRHHFRVVERQQHGLIASDLLVRSWVEHAGNVSYTEKRALSPVLNVRGSNDKTVHSQIIHGVTLFTNVIQ